MIDINELRRLALDGDLAAMQEIILRLEAAEKSDAESLAMYRKARDERDALRAALQHEADCVEAAGAEIEALRAKIEAAEKTNREWLRANAPGGWIDNLRIENTALLTKIEAMEKQEPYSYIYEYANPIDGSPVWRDKPGYWNAQFPKSSVPLYLAPGAQSVPSVPEVTDAMAIAFHAALTDGGIGQQEVEEIKTGLRVALAAIPEAKP